MNQRERMKAQADSIADYLKNKDGKVKFHDVVQETKDTVYWGSSPTSKMTTLMKYNRSIVRCKKEGWYEYQTVSNQEAPFLSKPNYSIPLPKNLFDTLKNEATNKGIGIEEYVIYLLVKNRVK